MRQFVTIFAGATLAFGLNLFSGPAMGAVLFHQDFTSSSTIADYVSATPTSGQFHSVAVQNGGEMAIVSDSLHYTFTSADPVAAGGFFRGSLGMGGVMHFYGTFTPVPPSNGIFGPTGHLTFGDFPDSSTNTTFSHANSTFAGINFRHTGNNLRLEAGGSSLDIPYGASYALNVYMNDSDIAQSYVGPDGNTYALTVAPAVDVKDNSYVQGSFAVWLTIFDDENGPIHNAIVTNAPANSYTHNINGHESTRVLDSILFNYAGHKEFDSGFVWSEITVNDTLVPEPSGLMLLGLALPMVMRRRRG